jgi:hypothetical protein
MFDNLPRLITTSSEDTFKELKVYYY